MDVCVQQLCIHTYVFNCKHRKMVFSWVKHCYQWKKDVVASVKGLSILFQYLQVFDTFCVGSDSV